MRIFVVSLQKSIQFTMLISFSVRNYRSIRDGLGINFLTVRSYKELDENYYKVKDKANILKSLVFYGANASGKSNLINALTGFVQFIKTSSSNKLYDKIELYDPFLLDGDSHRKPGSFEVDFLLNEVRYVYSFSINKDEVLEENLFFYPKGQKVRVFERTGKSFKYGNDLKGEKKSIEMRLLPNQLFLSKASNENISMLVDIYGYFFSFEDVASMYLNLSDHKSLSSIIGTALKHKSDEFYARYQTIITSLDFGVESLVLNPVVQGLQNMASSNSSIKFMEYNSISGFSKLDFELFLRHRVYTLEGEISYDFEIERESSGTKNLLILALSLLEVFERGAVLIVDEFEKSLHPQIVRKLIEMFHDDDVNINHAQLVFSTHDISLLDNRLFRRDQIWFTEKNESGSTVFYSMSQYEGVRKDTPYDKWYLSGRFGATPVINESQLKYGNVKEKRN